MQVCVFVKDGSTTAHQPLPCPLPPKTLLVLDTVVKREKRKIVVVLGKKEEFGTN